MTSHSPEARGQELAAVHAAVSRAVRALNVGWFAAPDGTRAIGTTEQILLMVGGTEDVVPNEAEHQDNEGVCVRELDRMVN